LEELDILGVVDPFLEKGFQGPCRIDLQWRSPDRARRFHSHPEHSSVHLMLPQPDTERFLAGYVENRGVQVERAVELSGFDQDGNGVTAQLTHADGSHSSVRARWLVGCDGAHSSVRHLLDIPFVGHALEQRFLLADVHVETDLSPESLHVFSHPDGLLAIFPLGGDHFRLIADNPPSFRGRTGSVGCRLDHPLAQPHPLHDFDQGARLEHLFPSQ